MLNRKTINLNKKWITKPLHKDAFAQVVIKGNASTMHRLYMITNEIEDRQDFLELQKNDKLNLTAVIIIKPGYTGMAKSQAEILKFMRNKVIQRPEFTIKVYIYDKIKMLDIFNFKHITTNEKEVYNLIPKLQEKILEIV